MTAFSTSRPLTGGATDTVKLLADSGSADGDITLLQIAQYLAAKGLAPTTGTALEQLIAAKYAKPGSGVPLTDLAAAVQLSLAKADSAVQPEALAAKADRLDPVAVASGATLTRAAHYGRLILCPGGTLTVSTTGQTAGDFVSFLNTSTTTSLVVTIDTLTLTIAAGQEGQGSYNGTSWINPNAASGSYTDEQAQDATAAMIAAGTHTGITFAYDDAGNRLSATVTASGSYTDEQAQDAVAAAFAAGTQTGVTVTYNDAANSLSIKAGVPATITGTAGVGYTLTATLPAGVTAAIKNWTRNGADISGATGLTYTQVTADAGTLVGFRYVADTLSTGVSVPVLVPIKLATFGDSRAALAGAVSPDLYDGTARNQRVSLNAATAAFYGATLYRGEDLAWTVDGGVAGESTGGWNSGSRSGGKTITAINAGDWDVCVVQYGTNDIQGSVNSTATAGTVAASVVTNIKALITSLLGTGRKVIFMTTMGRTAAGWTSTFTTEKTQATDWVNYGNGSTIDGMVPWCAAQATYGTRLFVLDMQAALNVGGVATGALADVQWMGDGVHPGYYGTRKIGKALVQLLDTMYARPANSLAIYRSTGINLIPDVSATYRSGVSVSNCAAGTVTYSTDAKGRKYGEVTITPNGTAGFYQHELLADVGTNGGRTPAGGSAAILAAGDKIQPRVWMTIDDGAGGVSVVNNVYMAAYCAYIGGTPAAQTVYNGQNSGGTALPTDPDIDARYEVPPFALTGDSSLIGAPAAGAGLRIYFRYHFGATTTPFRLRWTDPQILKVA